MNKETPFSRAAMQDHRSATGLEVAVVGMSLRFPGANSPDEFWRNLRDGVESITHFSKEELEAVGVPAAILDRDNYVRSRPMLFDIDRFAAEFFGLNPREAEIMDPQHRLFLECAWEALESAGCNPATCSELIGVFAGSDQNDYWQRNLMSNPGVVESIGDFRIMIGGEKDYLPTQVCYRLDLHGPGVNVQSACSTSLVAVHMACQSMLSGECSIALAGGVTVQVPGKAGYLSQDGMIYSPDGHCRAFDAAAQGTVFGSGVGVVVLKRLQDALRDRDTISAVILGSAINNDGARKVGFTAPSVDGQAAVISSALKVAGVRSQAISYIEAHGTGTPLGDPVEVEALKLAFGSTATHRQWCGIGSVKTNVGHLGAAAGIAGFIKTALALQHRQLPPSLHFEQPNPKIDFLHSPFYVQSALSDWPSDGAPRRAGVSSYGIGGTNAHVVLEEPPLALATPTLRPCQLLTLSARTPAALTATAANLVTYLRQNPTVELADVGFTLAVGRKAFGHRLAISAASAIAAADVLEEQATAAAAPAQDCNVAFLFPGQGTQFVNMARGLYQTQPAFAREVDRCCKLLERHLGLDLRRLLYPEPSAADEASASLGRTIYTQPALFVIEYALARLWMSWGIRPRATIGHSIGEYVAATLAGVFSLEDALAIVTFRGRLMDEQPGGAMLAVMSTEQELAPLLDGGLALAAVNRPELCVASGPTDEAERLCARLKQNGIECQPLRTSHAFHSGMMDSILVRFTERVAQATLHPPLIDFISNVTGTWITAAEATDPKYWARHLRSTVRFTDGLKLLLGNSSCVPLEMGPGRSLSSGTNGLALLPRPAEPEAELRNVLDALGKLWTLGVPVDWSRFYDDEERRRIPLPTYPFERERYWIGPGTGAAGYPGAQATGVKTDDIAAWFYVPTWQQSVRATLLGRSADDPQDCRWLVFVDDAGLGHAAADRLESIGRDVTTVRIADAFNASDPRTITIDPDQVEHFEELCRTVGAGDRPLIILHTWLMGGGEDEPGIDQVDLWQQRGFYTLIKFVQAARRAGIKARMRIAIVTDGMQAVTEDHATGAARASVIGACRVIGQEYASVTCCSIDVEAGVNPEQVLDQVLDELAGLFDNAVVAYRHGRRWLQHYQSVCLEQTAQSYLRDGAAYLITGGLGGLGLAVAKHFAAQAKVRLVLAGRSPLPPRTTWDEHIAAHADNDPTSRRILAVRALEEMGATVHTVAVDVADAAGMRAAVAEAEAALGPIRGIVHAAGVAGNGLIEGRSEQSMSDVLTPKVRGTAVLDAIFRHTDLDFFLLFSSVTALTGKFGQADYTAANACLDAFALERQYGAAHPRISINWDSWREAGMAVDTTTLPALAASRERALEFAMLTAEGMQALDRVLAFGQPRIVVSTREFQARLREDRNLSTAEAKAGPKSASASVARPADVEYVEPTDEVELQLVEMWEELLGISPIGIHDDFFELGGHSLLAVSLMNRIEAAFGRVLPASTLLDEGGTIEGLARVLSESEGSKQASSLVCLQPSGTGAPFFCVHAVGGTIFSYAKFAQQLGTTQPFYGLQARGHIGRAPHLTVEEMATYYINALQEVQSQGPYRIGGWSMGGVVAFEMVRQLAEFGQEVEKLVLIDSWLIPPNLIKVVEDESSLLRLFVSDIAALFGHSFDASEQEALRALDIEAVFERLFARINALNGLSSDGLDYIRTLFRVFVANTQAVGTYRPQPIAQDTLLIAAAERSPALIEAVALQGGDVETLPLQGWQPFITQGLRCVTVPGDHYSLLAEPNLPEVAKQVRGALERALYMACVASPESLGTS
jgi:acyl transferase domain-containing protein/thioesterase domain-containing protein